MRPLLLAAAFAVAACQGRQYAASEPTNRGQPPMESELVAIEFSGSKPSLDGLAAEAARLGWRIDTRTARALRILPPPNYEPGQFGILLDRIEALGLTDIGLRLIGPNGPVGPEG
jgi:hypothetical protein